MSQRPHPVYRASGAVLAVLLGIALLHADVPADSGPPDLVGSLRTDASMTGTVRLGAAVVQLRDTPDGARLVIRSRGGKVAWASQPGRAFVSAARSLTSWQYNHAGLRPHTQWGLVLADQVIAHRTVREGTLTFTGTVRADGVSAPYQFAVSTHGPGLATIRVHVGTPDDGNGPLTTVVLHGDRKPGEEFHGFGEQFAPFDLTGRTVPIVAREQGVGRGAQPVTWLADTFRSGAGGAWDWTYAPMPFYVTSELRGLFLDGPTANAYSVFDLSRPGVAIQLDARTLRAQVLVGNSPADLLREHTAATGRTSPLPAWTGDGAVVGVQGGSDRVRRIVDRLTRAGARIAAVWIQDWCGQVHTAFGQRLRWNWVVDRSLYPDWEHLVAGLRARGVRVLTYVNPYLATLRHPASVHPYLFGEAKAHGYLVRGRRGGPYLLDQDGFTAGLVDLSNPRARTWYAGVIARQVAGAGVAGWMADFGEMLPYDAVLDQGGPGEWHNRYPVAWAEVNEAACRIAGRSRCVTFFRAAGQESAAHAPLFWTGDQLVTWGADDGMASALRGMLSAGLSGMTLIHSDTGGYTTLDTPVGDYHRSSELLRRWTELSAFGVFLRTHEGSRPTENVQVYDPAEVRSFARMTRVYAALAPYRRMVVAEAARTGMPAIRATWLEYPNSPAAESDQQFFFGPKLLVAPVFQPGATSVRVHLPAGRWTLVWSGRAYGDPRDATDVGVPAPLGHPAVFYPKGDPVGERLAARIRRAATSS